MILLMKNACPLVLPVMFNIHQDQHRQMALCAARPSAAQVFLTSYGATRACNCSCVWFQLIRPLWRGSLVPS